MQGVVLQGPTTYCQQIIPLYSGISNVVWSMWDDEPQDNIEFIKKHIPVVLNKKPLFPGYLNVNMQTVSTLSGIKYLQERGVTEMLKTRGDIHISNVSKLLSLLKGREAAFMVICKEGTRPDLYYELVYRHYSHDYPDNFCTYGTTENMYNAFNFYVESLSPIPAESLITYYLLLGKGIDFNLNYDYLINNGISFFMNDLLENDIEILWLKKNESLVTWHSDKRYYLY
jgi:hypothetical protein